MTFPVWFGILARGWMIGWISPLFLSAESQTLVRQDSVLCKQSYVKGHTVKDTIEDGPHWGLSLQPPITGWCI